ncbi:MAG: adenosylcobinamide-phosphate synthase CbiB [Thermodesulfobacterium sp.]|nr:adenosylcobinamide-phosphate synthase CbiB [Thermodesulfobacterium sp.]
MNFFEYLKVEVWEILLAFFLDLLIGDPEFIPHPIVGIGKLIEKTENFLRKFSISEKVLGIFLFLGVNSIVLSLVFLGLFFILWGKKSEYVGLKIFSEGLFIFLISQFLALKGLIREAQRVEKFLISGDLVSARRALRALVGRDTENLSEKKIRIAVSESLSENLNDAVLAPLFYLFLGGFPGMVFYKTVNTLDSMVGYRDEKYLKLGWFSAKMDDLLNYLPARISGLMIVLTSFILGGSSLAKRSFITMLRDGRKHLSPNSGIPEAALAGFLGIKMGGPHFYKGVLVEKPYIGEELLSDYSLVIKTSCKVVLISSFLFLVLAISLKIIFTKGFY